MKDFLRELAIRIVGRAVVWEAERSVKSKQRAQRLQEVMRCLIAGRSPAQVERMERRMGLR